MKQAPLLEQPSSKELQPLRLRLLGLLAVSALAVAALVRQFELPVTGQIAFVSMSSLVIVSLVGFTWSRLATNRRRAVRSIDTKDPRVLPKFGWGTAISLARAVILGLLAGFLLVPRPPEIASWWPALLYTAFVIADFFDGFVARRTGMATELGATLDVELDALGTLIAVVLAIVYGNLPVWYLLIGLARYAFILGLAWRKFFGRPVKDLQPSRNRRLIAGFQMGFLSAALWPILPAAGLRTAALVFGGLSLVGFLRDWLVASAAIDPRTQPYVRLRSLVDDLLERLLPLARALTAGFVLARVLGFFGVSWSGAGSTQTAALAETASFAVASFDRWAFALFLLAGIAVLLGFLSSLGALVLTLFFALEFTCCPAGLSNQLPLVLNLSVLVLGPGAFVLYAPEGEVLRAEHGKPRSHPA